MKMAGLCWISVLLAVSLSIGDCATMDLDYVTIIAKLIEDTHPYDGQQFSVAVNIPKVPKTPKELEEVILPINWDKFDEDIYNGKVYKDTNIVVAVPQEKTNNNGKPYKEHAEKQVLDNLGDLANIQEGTILVLYSWMSPCGDRCTNEKGYFNILDKIEELKHKGKSFAFVFHTVYAYFNDNGKSKAIPEYDIKNTFLNLRKVIVDDNIFRCYYPDGVFKCVKCFVDPSPANPVAACVKK